MIGPPSSPVHTLHTLLEPPLVSGGWSGLHSTAMSAPPSPSVYKGVPADNQVIEAARRGGCSPKWVWDNQWICYTAHLWICRSGLIIVITCMFTHGGNNFEGVSSYWNTGLGIGSQLYWPQSNSGRKLSRRDCFIFYYFEGDLCECVPQLSLASRRFDNVLSQP